MTDTNDTPYGDGIDSRIGSMIEQWLTADTGEYCRFCRVEHVGDVPAEEKFCSEDCSDNFDKVTVARVKIGSRDMSIRGYD